MKKIAVIGLGIIGGSLCGALTNAGYSVDGFDNDISAMDYALKAGYIQNKAENLQNYEVVFLALPPMATIEYLDNAKFKDGALVCDICGVKESIEKVVYQTPRNYRYVGLHPMAGKETSGIVSATPNLFTNANLIITRAEHTDDSAIAQVKEYALSIGFGNIIECSANEHDKKIALTSQLAHIVSNAYVKSEQVQECESFTGGSFQDMTRIAGVDEKIWTPLYGLNRENIINELTVLIDNLSEYRNALVEEDDIKLMRLLEQGRKIREKIKRKYN